MREIALYGVCGGLLILALKLVEYRFLVVEHSVEIYGAVVATVFAAVGITRKDDAAVGAEGYGACT